MVNTAHPEYSNALDTWQSCRDAAAGEKAVKARGATYLPQLGEQDDPEYRSYKMRACYFNATGRTVETLHGMIFLKDPVEKIPDSLKEFQDDATLTGQSWYNYEKFIAKEVLTVGRSGSLVDSNVDEMRSYVCNYKSEQIINWKTRRIKGRTILSLVVLTEEVEETDAETEADPAQQPSQAKPELPVAGFNVRYNTGPAKKQPADEFEQCLVEQVRVLKLEAPIDNLTGDAVYTVEIWRKDNKGTWGMISKKVPERKGLPLLEIPFVFHGPNNLSPCVDRSPIEDIAAINLSHYRSSADLEHGRHFTGLPTAFAAGFDVQSKFRIGSAAAWVSSDSNAKASFLEFTGQGLGALDTALEQKEKQMAILGARMLEAPKKQAETVEALSLKQTGEQASLGQISVSLGESFTIILRLALWWQATADKDFKSTEGAVEVEMNTDFNPAAMSPQMLTALVATAQAGYLTKDSVVTCLKRGEIVSASRTVEEELAKLETELPTVIPPKAKPGAAK